MQNVRARAEEIRNQYDTLKDQNLPVDVISFAELDLGLEPLLVPGLSQRFRIDAAIGFDFKSLYVDKEQYLTLDERRPWVGRRFRFSVAHELGHYFMHQGVAPAHHCADIPAYIMWCRRTSNEVYSLEQEANEFAGALLVPAQRLESMVGQTLVAFHEETGTKDYPPPSMREQFCGYAADKFQVNTQVISVRLDREGFWTAA